MSDLDSLRPDVREAVERISEFCRKDAAHRDYAYWQTIRAELIRLQGERDALEAELRAKDIAGDALVVALEDAGAKRDALARRISEASFTTVIGGVIHCHKGSFPDDWEGQRVALVKV